MAINKDMMRILIDGFWVVYMPDYVTVMKSYNMSLSYCHDFCEKLKKKSPYTYKRTVKDWEKELIAHIILYRLNLFTKHTVDTDLDEEEIKRRLIAYDIIYAIYKIMPFKIGIFK